MGWTSLIFNFMDVKIKGFKNQKQAEGFLNWFICSGEQAFTEWNIWQKDMENCPDSINVKRKGNFGCYDLTKNQITAHIIYEN